MDYTWNNYTVLVAEDDPLNFRYIQLLLEKRAGINIVWAKDGKEAIEYVKSKMEIDIILLDLQLPEMDGISALKIIRKIRPYLPVLIQTANTWNNEEDVCLEAGADGFFTKPLDISNLLKKMDTCLLTYASRKDESVKS